MGSFTGFKKLGGEVLDYMMRHRPTPDEEMSMGFHDLDNLFPGVYSGKHKYPTGSGSKIDDESMRAIMTAQGNPDAMVDVYRAVPKGVRDFNTGDWVTTSKAYAKEHGKHALDGNYDIIKGKARAADISSPGDSIAEQGYWGDPMIGKVTRGLLPLVAAGGAAAALAPGEAEAAPAVFAKDGRRLKDAFEKATRGLLTPAEPDFRFDDALIPDKTFKSIQSADPSFTTPELGLSEGDIFHIWNDHGKEMSSDGLEDGVHAILYGGDRFHTLGNPPHENGLGSIVDGKGYNASLKSDGDYTHVYQMNPIKAKRLLKKRSPSDPMDGAAGHPISIQPDESGSISQRAGLSADMGALPENVSPDTSDVKKNGASAAVLGGVGSADGAPVDDGLLRQFLLGTRGVLEGVGGAADYVRDPLNSLNGMLGGDPEYFRNPGVVLSDAMGLPLPQNDTERSRVGLNQGVSGALTESAAGGGIAKYGAGKVADFGRFVADSPWLNSAVGGILGYFGGGDR